MLEMGMSEPPILVKVRVLVLYSYWLSSLASKE